MRATSPKAVITFHRGMAGLLADRLTSTNLLRPPARRLSGDYASIRFIRRIRPTSVRMTSRAK